MPSIRHVGTQQVMLKGLRPESAPYRVGTAFRKLPACGLFSKLWPLLGTD